MIFQKKNLKKGIRHRLELLRAEEPIADDFFREIKEEYPLYIPHETYY